MLAGMLPRDHLRHTVCGRICLHETQFEQFVRKLGGEPRGAAEAITSWARVVLASWEQPPRLTTPIQGNTFQWWDARWIEWQGSPKAAETPRPAATVPHYTRDCPHLPPCENGPNWQCQQRTELERAKATIA